MLRFWGICLLPFHLGRRLVLQGGHPVPRLSQRQDGKPPWADWGPRLNLGKLSSSSLTESNRTPLTNPDGSKARSSCLRILLHFRE